MGAAGRVVDPPDPKYDAFRRTDIYGPAGQNPVGLLRLAWFCVAGVTLVPLKAAATVAWIFFFYCVCKCVFLARRTERGGRKEGEEGARACGWEPRQSACVPGRTGGVNARGRWRGAGRGGALSLPGRPGRASRVVFSTSAAR
jgi:hypothetical protein